MADKATDYQSSSMAPWISPKRHLRLDSTGLKYEGSDQKIELEWKDVRALVAAAVSVQTAELEENVPALGIALHVPFASPILIDGHLPNLDYAFPISDLAEPPMLGVSVQAEEIFKRAAEYAATAGVRVLGASASA